MKQAVMLLMCVLTGGTLALADQVGLLNGDRLTGSVESLSGGRLSLKTGFAGTIEIDWSQVGSISTTQGVQVQFSSGHRAEGVLASPEPGRVQVGGDLSASLDRIVSLSRADRPSPGFWQQWHGAATAGYTVTRGNTDLDNFSLNFHPVRRTGRDRLGVQLQSLYSVQNGSGSTNMHRVHGRYDRFLSPVSFLFFQARAETDEREKLASRTSQGAGIGREFQLGSHTGISIFGGLTFLQEDFQDLEPRLRAEGLGGVELETSRFHPLNLATAMQVLPLLSEGRYRMEWTASLRLPLLAGFDFGLEMFDNYDSQPPRVEVRKNDFGLLSTFGFTF